MTPQLSNDIIEFLTRDSTREFLSAAKKFVDVLEDKTITKEVFLKLSHSALIDVYAAGHKLQEIELKYSNTDSDFNLEEIFDNQNAGLTFDLGEEAFYWEVFDPTYSEKSGEQKTSWTTTDREASQGWLVDDFGDIYRDLKMGLTKIETIGTDEAIEDALWELKFSFRTHWGGHAINAMRYLHYYWYNNKL